MIRRIPILFGVYFALSALPVVPSMATIGSNLTTILVNNKIATLTRIYSIHHVSYVPLTAIFKALPSVHGATMRGAPPDEFTVYAVWNKNKQKAILKTPRYHSSILRWSSLPFHQSILLILDGQKLALPVWNHAGTTYISLPNVTILLSHLQVHTSFLSKNQWSWIAKPMTSSSIWIDDTPPFQGRDVTWKKGSQAINALPNGTKFTGVNWGMGASFQASAFDKVQSFQGQLVGTPFVVTFYMLKSRPSIPLVGIRYGKKVTAFSPGPGDLYPVNFTGKDLIIRDASNYNHWMAVSLKTGQYSLTYSNALLTGFAKSMPPAVGVVMGPSYVLGLPHRYPSIG